MANYKSYKWAVHLGKVYFDDSELPHREWYASQRWGNFETELMGRVLVDKNTHAISTVGYKGNSMIDRTVPKPVIKEFHRRYGFKDYEVQPWPNPSKVDMGKTHRNSGFGTAAKKSEEWHGRKSQGVREVEEVETFDDEVAELADLEELGVLGSDGKLYTITFKKDRPKLCSDAKGQNLEFIGGDQGLEGINFPNGKRMMPLGYCVWIVYETDKHHLEGSNGYPESYQHYFAEEYYKQFADSDDFKTPDDWFEWMLGQEIELGHVQEAIKKGFIPMLNYNKTDRKLCLVGGKYTVEDVGIKD